MKLKIVSVVLLCMLTSAAGYGQQNTAKFNDGTVIDYEIVEKNPDKVSQYNISFLNGFNLNYFKPNKYSVTANYAIWKYGVEGIVYFSSFEKEKAKNIAIKSEHTGYRTVTNYMIKPVLPVKTSIGIHLGYNYCDYTSEYSLNNNILKTHLAYAGIAITRVKLRKILVNYGSQPQLFRRSSQINLFADVLYFGGRKYFPDPEDEDGVVYNNVDEFSRQIGFRVYFEGKSSLSQKKDFGFAWKLGYKSGPYKNNIFPMIASVGLYYGFN